MNISSDTNAYAIFTLPANRGIITELENKGSKVFQFAPVETVKIESEENKTFPRDNFQKIDWIIFPDIFAVDYFLPLLEESGIDLFELDEKRILAFGEAVSDKLRFAQVHADVIPNTLEDEDIFSAVLDYVGENNLNNLFFLIAKAVENELKIKDKLSEAGAMFAELDIFQTKIPNKKEISKLKTFLRGGAIDEFIFTSPEDVFSLVQILKGENLPEILTEVIVSGTNEITLQSLREIKLIPKNYQSGK